MNQRQLFDCENATSKWFFFFLLKSLEEKIYISLSLKMHNLRSLIFVLFTEPNRNQMSLVEKKSCNLSQMQSRNSNTDIILCKNKKMLIAVQLFALLICIHVFVSMMADREEYWWTRILPHFKNQKSLFFWEKNVCIDNSCKRNPICRWHHFQTPKSLKVYAWYGLLPRVADYFVRILHGTRNADCQCGEFEKNQQQLHCEFFFPRHNQC